MIMIIILIIARNCDGPKDDRDIASSYWQRQQDYPVHSHSPLIVPIVSMYGVQCTSI